MKKHKHVFRELYIPGNTWVDKPVLKCKCGKIYKGGLC
jgi:hypothetical protein